MRRAVVAGAVLIGVVAEAGCGSGSSAGVISPIAAAVSEATWTDGPWPFTVSEGVLRCRYSYQVTFAANGQEYALNREAVQSGHFVDVEAIARPQRSRRPWLRGYRR